MRQSSTAQGLLSLLQVELKSDVPGQEVTKGASPLTPNHWIRIVAPGQQPAVTRWPGQPVPIYLWTVSDSDREAVVELAEVLDERGHREQYADQITRRG